MNHIAFGLILIVIGVAIALFRKQIVEGSLEFQDRVYGVRIGGKYSKIVGGWLVPLLGLLLAGYGLLTLLGIIHK